MDPQTTLPRAFLLLLCLHLSPPGCRSSPLGGPGPASGLRGRQELLGRLRGRVLELQAGQMDLDPLQQGHGLAEAWETRAAAPAGLLGPGNSVLQALRGIRSPRMMRDSGCFGRRLDRIGSVSGLGCNVLRWY
ncbi:natriuretic peptides B isoform X2 [Physeter macrocephalus]|uniref:Natriuretic peptides B n=1 Tax=Physeter macrocephalus TaxID=9755 RepID=A0A2Y9FSK3_PHYMC|nr:natriuretic peptides B isoform X2 [Physeter catodon]|eukprot:XP_007129776.1 natriuretic peptides B [Physeter catodon]